MLLARCITLYRISSDFSRRLKFQRRRSVRHFPRIGLTLLGDRAIAAGWITVSRELLQLERGNAAVSCVSCVAVTVTIVVSLYPAGARVCVCVGVTR